jgi:phosphoglycerate dehydrogenase-like enzyme
MDKPKVLVADPISPKGVELLESGGQLLVEVKTGLKEDQLLSIAAEYSAIVVRSQTKITAKVIDVAKRLKAVGRACGGRQRGRRRGDPPRSHRHEYAGREHGLDG